MTNWLAVNQMGRLLVGAGLSVALWGCASGPAPIDHYYEMLNTPAARGRAGGKLA